VVTHCCGHIALILKCALKRSFDASKLNGINNSCYLASSTDNTICNGVLMGGICGGVAVLIYKVLVTLVTHLFGHSAL